MLNFTSLCIIKMFFFQDIHSIVKIPYTEENNSLYESFINANYIKVKNSFL